MNQKAVTISTSQLIEFLDQELNNLPDNRKGYNFIFVAQPSSHKTLYEWLEFWFYRT